MLFDGGVVSLLFCKGRVSRVVGKRLVWRYGGVGVKVDMGREGESWVDTWV